MGLEAFREQPHRDLYNDETRKSAPISTESPTVVSDPAQLPERLGRVGKAEFLTLISFYHRGFLRQAFSLDLCGPKTSVWINMPPFLVHSTLGPYICLLVILGKNIYLFQHQCLFHGCWESVQMGTSLFGHRPLYSFQMPGLRRCRNVGCEMLSSLLLFCLTWWFPWKH